LPVNLGGRNGIDTTRRASGKRENNAAGKKLRVARWQNWRHAQQKRRKISIISSASGSIVAYAHIA